MDLKRARALLESGGYTCVLCRGEAVHTATARGVKPLVDWLDSGLDLNGFSAADKVVGRATAFLYVLLGVKEVWAGVMSEAAAEVLTRHGIAASQDKLVPNIINRAGTGICPFEEAVLEIQTPEEALALLRAAGVEMTEAELQAQRDKLKAAIESLELIKSLSTMYDDMTEEDFSENGLTPDEIARMKLYMDKLLQIGAVYEGSTIEQGCALKLKATVDGKASELEKTVLLVNGSWVFSDFADLMD
jgi:hypothetical protein